MEYHDRYGRQHSRDKDASYDEKANSKGTTTNHLETPLAAIYEICCHYRYHHEDLGTNEQFMKQLVKYGVKIMPASDAHVPEHVGMNIKELYEKLQLN